MSEFGSELIRAARHEIGAPFRHHYKPVNACEGGRITADECMERGLDSSGYDCTGLVITSMCNVLGLKIPEWPQEYRHSYQLKQFGEDKEPDLGDILLVDSRSGSGYQYNTHMGIRTANQRVVHANGKTKVVDEGEVMGIITGIKVIDMSTLLNALGTHIKSLKL